MNLVVDIGNTRIKVAVVQGDEVLFSQAYASSEEALAGEWQVLFPTVEQAIVASTGESVEEIVLSLRAKGLKVLAMDSTTAVPIGNDYLTPATLGVDRLAAAVAAVEVMGCRDCLIVDFGTAITIDLVENGVFRGGNISPGMKTRFRSLHDYTHRLPECEPTDSLAVIGRSTREAIEQGLPWEMSKCFDHSAALSPEFVPLAELGAIDNLRFELKINGEVRQAGVTSEMLFSVDEIISHVSKYMTLKIGDLIYTGTPCGVGPVKVGDNLVATLEGRELLNFDIR